MTDYKFIERMIIPVLVLVAALELVRHQFQYPLREA